MPGLRGCAIQSCGGHPCRSVRFTVSVPPNANGWRCRSRKRASICGKWRRPGDGLRRQQTSWRERQRRFTRPESSPLPCAGPGRSYLAPVNSRSHFALAFDISRPQSRAERIARIEWLSTLLDTALVIPGTNIRFGLDALIGLVPGIGDIVSTALSLYIVREARALGAPRLLIARMLANVALDGMIGAVPVAGDVFDVAFRANRRNVALLRAHLDRTERRLRRARS
ncbi:MAG: DUF4112 domain-containing protein [Xanthobacteraceae bacterium]|nr:DUF4112 domain-containing protein [Xanthobacteraceae bacterium]